MANGLWVDGFIMFVGTCGIIPGYVYSPDEGGFFIRAKRVSNSHLRSPRNSALLEKKSPCVCTL